MLKKHPSKRYKKNSITNTKLFIIFFKTFIYYLCLIYSWHLVGKLVFKELLYHYTKFYKNGKKTIRVHQKALEDQIAGLIMKIIQD